MKHPTPPPTSPSKRRVLAALDINTASPSRTPAGAKRPVVSPAKLYRDPPQQQQQSPTREPGKRAFAAMVAGDIAMASAAAQSPPKKPCLGPETASRRPQSPPSEAADARDDSLINLTPDRSYHGRPQSASPAASSVFDTSTADITTATAVTEPDMEPPRTATATTPAAAAAAAAPPRRQPTREDSARQTAETLRWRLRLAAYKLHTGQTDVPLERLQRRPVPATATANNTGSASFSTTVTVNAFNSSLASTAREYDGRRPRRMPSSSPRKQQQQPAAYNDAADDNDDGEETDDEDDARSIARPRSVQRTADDDMMLTRLPPLTAPPPQQPRRPSREEVESLGGAASGLLELRNSSQ